MSDLVNKYQHYFNESVKLQETVNEQLAYIVELEDAIISLDEAYGSLSECIKGCPDMDIDLRQQCKAECAREFNEKQKGLDEMAITIDRLDQHERGKRGAKGWDHMTQEMQSDKVHGKRGKVVGTLSPKGTVAHDLEGNFMGRVNDMNVVIPPPYKAKKNKK